MLGKGKGKNDCGICKDSALMDRSWEELHRPAKDLAVLFLGMLAFKFSCDAGYLWLSTQDQVMYPLDFSAPKYAVGLLSCIVLFFSIRHGKRRASSFLLYFVFLFQMIPITTVYALANESTQYYLVLCIAFFMCSLIVGYVREGNQVSRNAIVSRTVLFGYGAVMVLIVALIVARYGAPSLDALDIYSVYELRSSGTFELGKYENYLFSWVTSVILPAGIAWALTKRKYLTAGIFSVLMLMMYLYSGNKTFLFSIPLVVVCTLWSRRENFYKEIFTLGCIGMSVLVILLWVSPVMQNLIQRVFSLLVRRVMLLPANNKFHYFEYFSNNPKMGLGGIFPRWLIYIPNYYENIPYSYEISAIFYNQPEMNSNTGFLAEGYMRFGHVGTIGILLLFALILKQIDHFQDRSGYSLAIGVFIYQVYSLTDAHLIDSLVLGPWMILVIILMLCGAERKKDGGLYAE